MKASDFLSRDYSMSDSKMCNRSKLIIDCAKEDLALLSIFDNTFSDSFLNGIKADILNAEGGMGDSQVVNTQMKLTINLDDEFLKAKQDFHVLQYFVEMAFPDEKIFWDEFGREDFSDARKTPEKLVPFLRKILFKIIKYKPELAAKGYGEQQVTTFTNQIEVLNSALEAQNLYKSDRPVLTTERIELLNSIYHRTIRICKIGTLVFDDNLPKYNRYVFYNDLVNSVDIIKFITNQKQIKPLVFNLIGKKDTVLTFNYGDGTMYQITLTGSEQVVNYTYAIPGSYDVVIDGNVETLQVFKIKDAEINHFVLPTTMDELKDLDLSGNHLTEVPINNLLMALNKIGTDGGNLNLSGGTNHVPSGGGINAMHKLQERGWLCQIAV